MSDARTTHTSDGAAIEVVDTGSRFEARVDGKRAGASYYRVDRGRVVFTHTLVEPAWEGQGVGSALAGAALVQVRASGRKVVARCPFIGAYLQRHPEFADLL